MSDWGRLSAVSAQINSSNLSRLVAKRTYVYKYKCICMYCVCIYIYIYIYICICICMNSVTPITRISWAGRNYDTKEIHNRDGVRKAKGFWQNFWWRLITSDQYIDWGVRLMLQAGIRTSICQRSLNLRRIALLNSNTIFLSASLVIL